MSTIHTQPESVPPGAIAVRLATAYQVSQAVFAALELELPALLSEGALTSTEVADARGCDPDMMHRLLRALAAIGVVNDLGGRFALSPVGLALHPDAPGTVLPIVRFFGGGDFRQCFDGLGQCVRTGKTAIEALFGFDNVFDYYAAAPEQARAMNQAMTAISARTGPNIAAHYDFSAARHLVDVGGGQGRMLIAILHANPHLHGTVFDLPHVVATAPPLLAQDGVADRVATIGGNMFDGVPGGADVYLLSHVIHDWDDAHSIRVLRACAEAMQPGGRVLIVDRVMPDVVEPGPAAQANHLLDLTMMLRTPGGRERTATEFTALLGAAGLRLARIIPTPLPDSIIEAVLEDGP